MSVRIDGFHIVPTSDRVGCFALALAKHVNSGHILIFVQILHMAPIFELTLTHVVPSWISMMTAQQHGAQGTNAAPYFHVVAAICPLSGPYMMKK
jgi:hypothetical protein